MKYQFYALFQFSVFVALQIITSETMSEETCNNNCTSTEIDKFIEFKKNYSKYYSTPEEECLAMEFFCQNYRKIIKHNSRKNSTFRMAVTAYTDQESRTVRASGVFEDIPREALAKKTSANVVITAAKKVRKSPAFENRLKAGTTDSVDNSHLTGPVKDQGRCGSCWAFCASYVLQYQALVYRNISIEISDQELLDCNDSPRINACTGGNPFYAFWYANLKGVSPMVKYPYRMDQGSCRKTSKMEPIYKSPFESTFTLDGNAQKLKNLIDQIGVVATGMATTDDINFYESGVYNNPECPKNATHCVTVVGYGTDPKFGDYWLIKNSWGIDWGEKGYFRMKRGINMCGLESFGYYFPMPK